MRGVAFTRRRVRCLGSNAPRPARACNAASEPFGGGTGTALDPYTLCTEEHVRQIRSAPAANFEFAADVTLTTDWLPIPVFSGVIDGNGFSLRGLRIDNAELDRAAFVDTLSGDILHIAFEDAVISARSQVATVAVSVTAGALINNILVRTHVTATASYACGVACSFAASTALRGALVEGRVENFASGGMGWTGGVATSVAAGAIVSDVDMRADVIAPDAWKTGGITVDLSGMVRRVQVSGTVHGDNRTGGVVSVLIGDGRIDDALVTGTVRSTSSVAGGIFAETWSATTPSVTRVVVTGLVVVGDGGSSRGVCAMSCDPASYEDVYYVDETTTLTSCGLAATCTGLTVTEAQDPETFDGFSALWRFASGAFPTLCDL